MASAQVLPNSAASSSSRKQGHLEAGKRRLEEFRKKKAEGRTKKAASTSQLQSADVSQNEKLPQESENLKLEDSDGATSERDGVAAVQPSYPVMIQDSKANNSSLSTELDSLNTTNAISPALPNDNSAFYKDQVERPASYHESKWRDGLGFSGQEHGYYDRSREEKNDELRISSGKERELTHGVATDHPIAPDTVHRYPNYDGNIHQFSFHSLHEAQSEENGHSSKEYPAKDPGTSIASSTSNLPEKLASVPMPTKVGYAWTSTAYNAAASYDDSMSSTTNLIKSYQRFEQYKDGKMDFNNAGVFEMGGNKLGGAIDRPLNGDSAPWRTSESFSSGSSLNFSSSSNQTLLRSPMSETSNWRSRPSFLDSLNLPRGYSVSQLPSTESEKSEPFFRSSSKVISAEIIASSASQEPSTETDTMETPGKTLDSSSADKLSTNSFAPVSYERGMPKQGVKDGSSIEGHDFSSVQNNGDFAALEQHIEDLTQEKFALQRALEASRALAESLAVENSSLTDSFNQQGAAVNQLKSDMERLQEEIRDQLMALEALKMEYANAQLECSAADERAKMLTSEVIGLEEKALRLRSNELKLERDLEKANAEMTSYKRKVSSLEKERQDLQSTIDALKEEKKLLQSKLRKASTSGKVIEAGKSPTITRDESTSTEDLDDTVSDRVLDTVNNDAQTIGSSVPSSNLPSFLLPQEHRQFGLSDASDAIPHDHLRMISNINSLISELALEKEELMRALSVESSNSTKLKDLNKELSQKLEVQTQRLELLTAQRMAHDNALTRPTESTSMPDSAVYADEGDEVVERVLGWIMKLFPGGPSKRRTSKLL
ncbi:protein BLISTER [Magnolia sinica]|uniref:protein BLISTER n=1 Tax=Magnolia sinica TaxID=86752 RepID=UPI00265A6DCF|nr:protein BLISTER [Magnolia sinica]